MDKAGLIAFHRECIEKMHTTLIEKNHDYAGASADPFSNFTRVEVLDICSPEQGFLTRMSDKFSRITTFVKQGVLKVKDETVVDSLVDLANYCILMAAYIKSKRDKAQMIGAGG